MDPVRKGSVLQFCCVDHEDARLRGQESLAASQELAENDAPLRPRVPKNARKAWGQCLATATAEVNAFNDGRAWVQFFALPQLVLAQPPRVAPSTRRRSRASR